MPCLLCFVFRLPSLSPGTLLLLRDACIRGNTYQLRTYIVKIKIHSSCEIEYFVETHLCKLCVYDELSGAPACFVSYVTLFVSTQGA